MDRVLVLPHVGTAMGHVIRTGEYIRRFPSAEYYVAVPRVHTDIARRFLPSGTQVLVRDAWFSVNSADGSLDVRAFREVIGADIIDCKTICPDWLLGDPGLRAAIVGTRMKLPWRALAHGCYLPMPRWVRDGDGELAALGRDAWAVAGKGISTLLHSVASDWLSWEDLRKSGEVIVPDWPGQELPSDFPVIRTPRLIPTLGRESGVLSAIVVATSSGLPVAPPREVLEVLAKSSGDVAVVGASSGPEIAGVRYLSDRFALHSLVGDRTIAIVHGGYGTVGTVTGRAERVLALPQDLDQLCNVIVSSTAGVETVPPGTLRRVIEPSRGLRREPFWPSLDWLEGWIRHSRG